MQAKCKWTNLTCRLSTLSASATRMPMSPASSDGPMPSASALLPPCLFSISALWPSALPRLPDCQTAPGPAWSACRLWCQCSQTPCMWASPTTPATVWPGPARAAASCKLWDRATSRACSMMRATAHPCCRLMAVSPASSSRMLRHACAHEALFRHLGMWRGTGLLLTLSWGAHSQVRTSERLAGLASRLWLSRGKCGLPAAPAMLVQQGRQWEL